MKTIRYRSFEICVDGIYKHNIILLSHTSFSLESAKKHIDDYLADDNSKALYNHYLTSKGEPNV